MASSGIFAAPVSARRTVGEAVGRGVVEVAERQPQRRCAGDDGDATLADRVERGRRIETLHQHDGGATEPG